MNPCLRALLALVLLGGCSCGGGGPLFLAVGLRTDFVPGAEFSSIRLSLDEQTLPLAVDVRADYRQGVRAAELLSTAGPHRVVAELIDDEGEVVGSRSLALSLTRATAVTLTIYAACRGIECPAGQSCIRGECLDEGLCDGPCDPSDPGQCVEGVCEEQCPDTVSCFGDNADGCSARSCFTGSCLSAPIAGACEPGEYCAVGLGCEPGIDPTLDGGLGDAGPEDADVPDGTVDGDCGAPCQALCGTTGTVGCVGTTPTGSCDPPAESCTGRDDDCDGEIDEGLDCDHTHGVVCQVNGFDDQGRPVSQLVGQVAAHPSANGQVCAAGFCTNTLPNCRTLPGPNGHTHRAFINGSDSIQFFSEGTLLSPNGTSNDDGHSHSIGCSIFNGGGGGGAGGSSHVHVLDSAFEDDELIYNRFCVPPVQEGAECAAMWGDCEARR